MQIMPMHEIVSLLQLQLYEAYAKIDTWAKSIDSYFNPFSAEDDGIMRNLYTNVQVGDKFTHDIVNLFIYFIYLTSIQYKIAGAS